MQPSAAFLLLLFGNAVVSAQNCLQLPDVSNAQLQNPQDAYQKGDTISFNCNMGYTSGRQIRYVCTDDGWHPLHRGICRLKPCVLPDDIPNGYYQIITGEDFVFGTTIKYFCNEGYQMVSKEVTRTCFLNDWSNHLPVCEPLSCEAPPPVPGVMVEGLPIDDVPILPDRLLTFSCRAPGYKLNSSGILVCGKDGNWDNPFPSCAEISCELPASNNKVRILGVEGGAVAVAAGNRITVQCLKGSYSTQVQCLLSGQWDSTFPTCSDSCDVALVSDNVIVSPNVRQLQKNQRLQFRCRRRSHVLHGVRLVTCLEDGQWSHPFPSCTDPGSCGSPPSLENGDYFGSANEFPHNARVQYQCQDKYIMQGGPYKTCFNGVWTGDITCLKPCTVNPDLMVPNKIKFRFGEENKLYAPHHDYITFDCVDGASHNGQAAMRQQCLDGEMTLPRCV